MVVKVGSVDVTALKLGAFNVTSQYLGAAPIAAGGVVPPVTIGGVAIGDADAGGTI